MKKVYSTLLISTFLLAGCQDASSPSEVENEAQTEEAVEQESVAGETTTQEEENTEDTDETDDSTQAEEEVTYQYKINPETFSVQPIEADENSEEKLVLLTYDDAPYGNTMEIAKALDERGVSAIFFVNGMYMEDEEGFETIQEVHDMGFEIANHTHTHATLPDYTEEEQRDEILKTNDIIEEAIGEKPRFFRAPHGVNTDYSNQLIEDEGMLMMNWSFGYDWMGEYQDPTALADITLNTDLLSDGANILMHDRTWTAEATPEIVDGLIEQGYTIIDPKLITHEPQE